MRDALLYGILPLVALNVILLVVIAVQERKLGRVEGRLQLHEEQEAKAGLPYIGHTRA